MVEKYGLVVGCNYQDTNGRLNGCINDAKSINEILMKRFGFEKDHVMFLTDEPGNKHAPTARCIKWVLTTFFSVCKPGDLVFFFFAGHGTIVPANLSNTGKPEQAICASDNFNPITCPDFRAILKEAPTGVQFVFVSDSCHSGDLIDTVKVQIGPKRPDTPFDLKTMFNMVSSRSLYGTIRCIPFEVILQHLNARSNSRASSIPNNNNIPALLVQQFGEDASLVFRNNVPMPRALKGIQTILLSGCQADEASDENTAADGKIHGYFTWAILDALKMRRKPITNRDLVLRAQKYIKNLNNKQHPCLYCSDEDLRARFLSE